MSILRFPKDEDVKCFINIIEMLRLAGTLYQAAVRMFTSSPGPDWAEVHPPEIEDTECYYYVPKLVSPVTKEVGFVVRMYDIDKIKKIILGRLDNIYSSKYLGSLHVGGVRLKLDHTSIARLQTCESVNHTYIVNGVGYTKLNKEQINHMLTCVSSFKRACQKRFIELNSLVNSAQTSEDIYALYKEEFERGWPTNVLE